MNRTDDPIRYRLADADDESFLADMIFTAWRWDWDSDRLAQRVVSGVPDSYVTGFGSQPWDLGVIADIDGLPVAAAWCRLLTGDAARAGWVADDTPELALAAKADHRGRGLGRAVLERLIEAARVGGVRALSLHVDADNVRAQSLYRSCGFATVRNTDKGEVMLLRLS